VVVVENGIKYHVDLSADSLSSGLFLDQRANRKWMVNNLFQRPGMTMLNLFAHTGAWSLVAAVKAKALTRNVDHSPMCLDSAIANFELNGIGYTQNASRPRSSEEPKKRWHGPMKQMGGHEFVARDSFSELANLRSKNTKFDVVVLDPPAVARTSTLPGAMWSAKSGYGHLVKLTTPLVAPSGFIVAFNNTRSRSEEAWLREIEEKGLKDSRAKWRQVTLLGQDVDFRWRPGDERVGKYLKGVVLQRI